MDISKYFRVSRRLRDNESWLYMFLWRNQKNIIWIPLLSVVMPKVMGKNDVQIQNPCLTRFVLMCQVLNCQPNMKTGLHIHNKCSDQLVSPYSHIHHSKHPTGKMGFIPTWNSHCAYIQLTWVFALSCINWTMSSKTVSPNILTLKMPRKPASENVVCLCCLLNILANFPNLFLNTGKQCGPWSDCS